MMSLMRKYWENKHWQSVVLMFVYIDLRQRMETKQNTRSFGVCYFMDVFNAYLVCFCL